MTAHPAIAAVPTNAQPSRSLLQAALILNVAYIMPDADDPQVFDPRGFGSTPRTIVIGWKGSWFWLDDADATTAHDGTTCIVTADAKRYKINGVDLLITSVISHTVTAQPASPAIGDAYRIPTGATGADWASKPKYVGVYTARGWWFIAPKVGWIVWTKGSGSTRDAAYHYDSIAGDWIAGLGSTPFTANSIALSAQIGAGASGVQKVENQTTYAPPGSRKTTATPTMPLGGTAANANDNNSATTATTSAIGDKTGASVANRIVAQLALAAATDLIAIEVKAVLGSAASTALAMGLYYSTDNAASWTQAGAGFSLTTSAQDIIRTGSFAGVTHVALVTEDKNWVANTHTLADINAYDATVDAAVGDAYIIHGNGFGIFSGHATKVAICEVEDTFTIYTPGEGDEVYDKALNGKYKWDGAAWAPTAGAIVYAHPVYTEALYNTSAGAGQYTYSTATPPTSALKQVRDPVGKVRAAQSSSSKLEFTYQAEAAIGAGTFAVFALYRDSEANALRWTKRYFPDSTITGQIVTFTVDAIDALEHTYYVALHDVPAATAVSLQHREFTIKEIA